MATEEARESVPLRSRDGSYRLAFRPVHLPQHDHPVPGPGRLICVNVKHCLLVISNSLNHWQVVISDNLDYWLFAI